MGGWAGEQNQSQLSSSRRRSRGPPLVDLHPSADSAERDRHRHLPSHQGTSQGPPNFTQLYIITITPISQMWSNRNGQPVCNRHSLTNEPTATYRRHRALQGPPNFLGNTYELSDLCHFTTIYNLVSAIFCHLLLPLGPPIFLGNTFSQRREKAGMGGKERKRTDLI